MAAGCGERKYDKQEINSPLAKTCTKVQNENSVILD